MFDSNFILRIPAILFSLTIHEFAHGWMARKYGDPTAELQGRLTLNPLSHLDVFGTMMILFGPFGWAKPVPVDPRNFNNPKRDMIKVAAAGPVINIITALVIGLAIRFFGFLPSFSLNQEVFQFLLITMMLNLGLAFFNLLPIPPLDGSNILMGFLPSEFLFRYQKFFHYLPTLFLGLIIIEWLFKVPTISFILNPLWSPFKNFFQILVFQRVLF